MLELRRPCCFDLFDPVLEVTALRIGESSKWVAGENFAKIANFQSAEFEQFRSNPDLESGTSKVI